ncbi:hypothetical protein M0811_07785 [Anaeramoeba ignava]|uniref:Uncharacterized protein n=1 Tax=Anaeramoeba ignava TaxID=1746090 RepID=A0A9Q0LPV0_ANAIG|nr:hypothetical protein M0811_07785 [Anaeramoeba ignava]
MFVCDSSSDCSTRTGPINLKILESSSSFSIIFLFENGKAIEYSNKNDSNQNPSKIKLKKNIQKVTVGSQTAILTKEGKYTNDRVIQNIVSGNGSIYLLTSNQNA